MYFFKKRLKKAGFGKHFCVLLSLVLIFFETTAQTPRCQFSAPEAPTHQLFEAEIEKTIVRMRRERAGSRINESLPVLTIPVIFHIVHRGEPVGVGANISAQQVASQLAVLNEDFNRRNADTSGIAPAFKPLAAKIGLRFVAATVSPEGKPLEEAGIHRYQTKISGFDKDNMNKALKIRTIWNPREYLNVWVVPKKGRFLGAAQFPVLSGLPGMENEKGSAQTEGIVVAYTALGRHTAHASASPFDRGRTLTHEMGHWLGLFHPWGADKGGCNTDDFCEDTPKADKPIFGCPKKQVYSCGKHRMTENFMEYTNDSCMHLFTQNQKERMLAAIETARFRKILGKSPALADTVLFAEINQSKQRICTEKNVTFSAKTEQIPKTTGKIKYHWTFEGGTPKHSQAARPTVRYTEAGSFSATLVVQNEWRNDTTHLPNAVEVFDLSKPEILPTSIAADFEDGKFPPKGWRSEGKVWRISPIGKESKFAAIAPNYYHDFKGKTAKLRTPILKTTAKFTRLQFTYAYATWQGSEAADTLSLYCRRNCDTNFKKIWELSGKNLAKGKKRQNPFEPFQNVDWEDIALLIPTEDKANIELMWVCKGNFGNNLYLDNISVKPFEGVRADFRPTQTYLCNNDTVRFINLSESFLPGDLDFEWQFEGGLPAQSKQKNPLVRYEKAGLYAVRLSVRRTDGAKARLHKKGLIRVIESKPTRTSLAEDFERTQNLLDGVWKSAPTGGFGKSAQSVRTENSAVFLQQSFRTKNTDYLEISTDYALKNAAQTDSLKILYSTDCGKTFRLAWQKTGKSLNTFTANSDNLHPNFADWQRLQTFVPLSGAAHIFLKFAFVTENKTNLFLDNLNILPRKGIIANAGIENFARPFCAGGTVRFINRTKILSENQTIRKIYWKFEGGTPGTSESDKPRVRYPNPGKYAVKLIVETEKYRDTVNLKNYVRVISPELLGTTVKTQDFEKQSVLNLQRQDWYFPAEKAWAVKKDGSKTENAALWCNTQSFGNTGDRIFAALPPLNLAGNRGLALHFSYAYAACGGSLSDTLCILLSKDCGDTFQEKWCGSGEELRSSMRDTTLFKPSPQEWKRKVVHLPSINPTEYNMAVRLAFKIKNKGCGVFYVDRIKIVPLGLRKPKADFTYSEAGKPNIFAGEDTISLVDLSLFGPKKWRWEVFGMKNYVFHEKSPRFVPKFPGSYDVRLTVSNAFGEDSLLKKSYFRVENRNPLDLQQPSTPGWTIYPNPSVGVFSVSGLTKPVLARVYTIFGQKIVEKRLSKTNNTLILSDYPKGIYILSLKNQQKTLFKKIIVR